RITALLDGAREELALLAAEHAEHLVVLGVAQALHDDLAGRGRRDATEALRGVVELDGRALGLVLVAHGPHRHVARRAVQLDARALVGARRAVVRGQQGLLDRRDEDLELDVPLAFQVVQDGKVDVHHASRSSASAPSNSASARRLSSPSTLPRAMSARGTARPSSSSTDTSSAALTRPSTCVPSRSVRVTSRPRARAKCLGSVSGRSVPGLETSRTCSPRKTSVASSASATARETSAIASRLRAPSCSDSRSTVTRTRVRLPAGWTVTSSRWRPASLTAGAMTPRT